MSSEAIRLEAHDDAEVTAVVEPQPRGNITAHQDNVIIVMDDPPTQTESGIHLARLTGKGGTARGARTALVLAVGPGHFTNMGVRVATTLQPGDRVVVDALCGQNYDLDLSAPRHNKSPEFQEICGRKGEFRIIREAEVLCVVDKGVRVG